jgi:hypothetical protein
MRKLLAAALMLAAVPAFAGEKAASEPGTHVEMPFLIAPMSADGKLLGYAYISSKLTTATPQASVEVRDKLAFIQDAFVRDVNAAPVGTAGDPATVDRAMLAQRLVADAKRVVGAAKVKDIAFTQIEFSPLHPKPTTDDPVPPTERAPAASPQKAASKP